jgi:hypothetical protein
MAALAVFAACSQSQQAGPGATATPLSTVSGYDTTNADSGGNCVREGENFRYYDMYHRQLMPWLQNYTPYPSIPYIKYYMALPTGQPAGATPIAVEISPGASAPPSTAAYIAEPVVPVMDWYIPWTLPGQGPYVYPGFNTLFQYNSELYNIPYGLKDHGTVVLLPAVPGALATDFEWDLVYRATQQANASAYANLMLSSPLPNPTPTPYPSPNPSDAARDKHFQAVGIPAVNALAAGAGPDDRFFSNYNMVPGEGGEPVQSADPHPRIVACDWLLNEPYDLIWTLIREKQRPDYAALQANLAAQRQPSSLINTAGWYAYEEDIFVARSVTPELWPPPMAQGFQNSDILNNAIPIPYQLLATVELSSPNPMPAST